MRVRFERIEARLRRADFNPDTLNWDRKSADQMMTYPRFCDSLSAVSTSA
jgi:hypothetical protein